MKVFWSWQSDASGKISRHFIRDAIKKALEEINAEFELEEAGRPAKIDQDRQGVPGSPDLAATIFRKISEATAFIADVTPIGRAGFEDSDPQSAKKLMNPNVAIELGYAISQLSDHAILYVLNTAFGGREDLPFDLRHKAGPITYRLGPNASKSDIGKEFPKLVGELKAGLREILVPATKNTDPSEETFIETAQSTVNSGSWVDPDKVAVRCGMVDDDDPEREKELYLCAQPTLYLRVCPSHPMNLSRSEAEERALVLGPFNTMYGGVYNDQNRFGGLCYNAQLADGTLLRGTQVFKSGEIWGFDTQVFPAPERGVTLLQLQSIIGRSFFKYLKACRDRGLIKAPIKVMLGLSFAAHIRFRVNETNLIGEFQDENVKCDAVLHSFEQSDLEDALQKLFNDFCDQAGFDRPENFGDFPRQG